MFYNLNIPHFYALLRKEHLYNHEKHIGEYEAVTVYAAQSQEDRAILFHVMLDNGSLRSRVPIHMLAWKDCSVEDLDKLQLWDCFSKNATVLAYDYLKGARVRVKFKDGTEEWGDYMMTFDWYDNGFSDEPSQYKCLHMIKLDSGNFALQPNNRLYWRHMSFTTKALPDKPDYQVDTKIWRCENRSDRWTISGDDSVYYYDITQKD